MTKKECLGFFGISDLMELPQAVSRLLALPLGERNRRYRELIDLNGHDMSRDWFQLLYEQELAQRKQKGQDFTSMEVASLLARIIRADGSIHEPTAGNGGLLIRTLWESQQRVMPWEWFPSEHQVECWELSDRSVPLLLLNLSIRGVMGVVYPGYGGRRCADGGTIGHSACAISRAAPYLTSKTAARRHPIAVRCSTQASY